MGEQAVRKVGRQSLWFIKTDLRVLAQKRTSAFCFAMNKRQEASLTFQLWGPELLFLPMYCANHVRREWPFSFIFPSWPAVRLGAGICFVLKIISMERV